uniref:pentatricopeptide repeat-containing protein At4g01400, mitochondrial-like n=1 Tax=Erigeron canadensis TaxID=72917 RepID=UPI001CB8FA40|nr:pentatricopeptide repeat-containing protein At4g01400, mitochondrial-like [Erigeron canadensis]
MLTIQNDGNSSRDEFMLMPTKRTQIQRLFNIWKIEEACEVLEGMLKSGEAPHLDTWMDVINRICEVETERLEEVLKVEIEPHTRIVDTGVSLQEYLFKKGRANDKFISKRGKV